MRPRIGLPFNGTTDYLSVAAPIDKRILLPRQPEKALQESIVQLLTLEDAIVFQYAKVGARPRCPKCGAWVGQIITQEKAHPDLLAIFVRHIQTTWLRRHIWWEVKRPGEKPDPDQLAMHARLRDAGDAVYVVESLEEVQAALRLEGFTLRTQARP